MQTALNETGLCVFAILRMLLAVEPYVRQRTIHLHNRNDGFSKTINRNHCYVNVSSINT